MIEIDDPEPVWDDLDRFEPAIGEIDLRLGYLLRRTDLLQMKVLRGFLSPIDMTPARATAIAWIRNNPGTGQSDLARALGINRASAMELASFLERFGAVERSPGRGRRSTALTLTDRGLQLYDQFIAATIETDAVLAAELSQPEREILAELLTRVRATLAGNLKQSILTNNQEGEMP